MPTSLKKAKNLAAQLMPGGEAIDSEARDRNGLQIIAPSGAIQRNLKES
jgi:hypothetical protein